MPTVTIGPENGRLTLHTGVEGRAAKAGHALTIRMSDWSGTVTLEGSEPIAVSFRTSVASLEVISGEGGVKPLTDKDRQTIESSALDTLSAAKHPDVTFVSRTISGRAGGYDVQGELLIAGTTSAVTAALDVQRAAGQATVETTVPVVQTEFGLKPYTGLMGGLRVRDRVDVRLSFTVPEPQ
ncbi:MAG: YceI family protein [Mycobacteriales bacterium]